jgi:hypothetical protein
MFLSNQSKELIVETSTRKMRGPLDTCAQHQPKTESAKPVVPVGTETYPLFPTLSTKWGIQLKKGDEWLWVATSSGDRYKFDTEDKARSAARMSYPDQMREQRLGGEKVIRIREIQNHGN